MNWPWERRARGERDRLLVRCVQLQAQLKQAQEHADSLAEEKSRLQSALQRVVDNALFAAGAAPIFEPEDERFQPRSAEAQVAASSRESPPLNHAEWRARVEKLDAEAAERNRKAELAEQLRKIAEEAKANGKQQ